MWLVAAIAVIGALTVLGLIAMWPRGDAPDLGDLPRRGFVDATITSVEGNSCPSIEIPGENDACVSYGADLHSGPDDGGDVEFQVLATDTAVPELHEGDKVVLMDFANSPDPAVRYQFYDYQRSRPLLWLVLAFAAVLLVEVRGLDGEPPPDDTWVEVSGRFDSTLTDRSERSAQAGTPVLRATSLRRVEEPREPYEYP